MAVIIYGKELAKKVRENLRIECEELNKEGIKSKLAVIMVGDDPASKVYVRNKSRACEDVGIEYEEYLLESNTNQKDLIDLHYYISENLQEPQITKRLISKILNGISILKYYPEEYPKFKNLNRIRKLVFKNYIILYSVNKKSKEIYILHIYYKSRNYQY